MTRAYSTTWDISLIFDYYQKLAREGLSDLSGPLSNADLPLLVLRDKCITLAKIKTGCRFVDLTKVFRRWVQPNIRDSESLAGLLGTPPLSPDDEPRITRWRYLLPKNVASLADVFSPWVDLGGYADVDPDDVNICLRSAVECYYRRTAHRQQGDDPTLFLVAHADRHGVYYAMSTDRMRNVVGVVMAAAGVPVKFRPHSTRHEHFR